MRVRMYESEKVYTHGSEARSIEAIFFFLLLLTYITTFGNANVRQAVLYGTL